MKKLITFLIALLLTTSSQAQWVNMNQTFNPRCYTATGSYLYISGGSNDVYRSTNNGINFTRISYTAFGNTSIAALGVSGTRVFAGTSSSGVGGFYYTTDGDTTWTQTFLSLVNNILVTPGYVYIISGTQVWRSSNNGVSFIQTNAPASYALGANASGSMVYCGGLQGLYSSNNNGSSWEFLKTLDSSIVSDIKTNGSNIYVTTKGGYYKPGSIWISTNNGGNWSRKQPYINTFHMGYYSMSVVNNDIFIASDSGVILTRDNGNTWRKKNEGLNSFSAVNIFYANGYLFIRTNYAELFRRLYTDAIIVKQISSEVPSSYTLSQNYPDPFNPSTTVGYTIPTKGLVTLVVYDLLGRVVATLVNEVHTPGTYSVQWNASEMPSGTYFYRIQTDQYTDTKRMVLIK